MSKYIKLADAIHNINLEVTGRKEYTGDMKANLFFALDDLPTIDIVLCKDCKHVTYKTIPARSQDVFYGCCYSAIQHDGDFYCAYGERIDNEQRNEC